MKIKIVEAGYFKLDGGAMFGVVPKVMWQRMHPADEANLCPWTMRSILIETDDRKILVDAGIGDKQDERFRSHFHPHGPHELHDSIGSLALTDDDITDVFITHLHFDHVGGAVKRVGDDLVPAFAQARYHVDGEHYDWALDPNPRERASFLKENFVPLEEHGVLERLGRFDGQEWLPGIRLYTTYGHTHGMNYLDIQIGDRHVIYCADVIPSSHHIGLPYVMAYDIFPLAAIEEKKALLQRAVERGDILLFEHDIDHEAATVKVNEKGRIVLDRRGRLADLLIDRAL